MAPNDCFANGWKWPAANRRPVDLPPMEAAGDELIPKVDAVVDVVEEAHDGALPAKPRAEFVRRIQPMLIQSCLTAGATRRRRIARFV